MPGMQTLSVLVSGLHAAQAGLGVTGHNMSNSETIGYTRQQVLQRDALSQTIGRNATGFLQVGLGTDIAAIRQIRNTFLDVTYRKELSKLNFYSAKYEAGTEVETVLGELEGQYKLDTVLKNLWNSINELASDQTSIGVRGTFIENVITFIDKANSVSDALTKYQSNLNAQIQKAVSDINYYVAEVGAMNIAIAVAESYGDNANDYRDIRNNALDQLSSILDITIKERTNGSIDILYDGKELLVGGHINKIGLRYSAPGYDFLEPVFTEQTGILGYDPTDSNARSLFNYNVNINPMLDNDNGYLKGLIVARGLLPANYTSSMPQAPDIRKFMVNVATEVAGVITDTPADQAANVAAYTAAYQNYEMAYQNFVNKLDAYNAGDRAYSQPPQAPMPPNPADYNVVLSSAQSFSAYVASAIDADQTGYKYQYAQFQREMFNINNCFIPQQQMKLDTLFHGIVKLINDTVSPYIYDAANDRYIKDPNAPYGQDGVTQYLEIFTRRAGNYTNRFDQNGVLIEEDPSDPASLYTMGNIELNPLLRIASNYNKIAFSYSGDQSDNRLLDNLVEQWKQGFIALPGQSPTGVDTFYANVMVALGIEINKAGKYVESQSVMVQQADYKRTSISGVSLDEEMRNMLQYQHAYNAAARVINVVDGMIDTLVNRTGRTGR